HHNFNFQDSGQGNGAGNLAPRVDAVLSDLGMKPRVGTNLQVAIDRPAWDHGTVRNYQVALNRSGAGKRSAGNIDVVGCEDSAVHRRASGLQVSGSGGHPEFAARPDRLVDGGVRMNRFDVPRIREIAGRYE